MPTIAEKILARAAKRDQVKTNEIVMAKVDVAMSHENADVVIRAFKEIGLKKVWDPERIVIIFDHRIPAESEKSAATHKRIREFVKTQNIKYFYDMREGICHQVLAEFGHCRPGEILVGTDSHTTTHGAFGTFAAGIGGTEMAGVWSTGEIWFKVPESMKITVHGKFKEFISAKDLILFIIGQLGSDGADYMAVEFHGSTISEMTIASRMVLSNLSMEMGAKVAFILPDEKTISFVRERTKKEFTAVLPDRDAQYARSLDVDAASLRSQIACPHAVDNVKKVREVSGLKINQALIGSCTNGRLEDLKVAASIIEGKNVHPDVRLLIIPASRRIYLDATKAGYIETLVKAGGLVLNPGCGPCLGAHQGLLAAGERCIATTNRNFQGRMGSSDAEVYLASPATVAFSAIKGEITEPC
ncbi:3-isopropylmalate dehydratase large subunit [candidate division WOR-3 bacterium RBG_13_43_14]|uniref:3-isopropylmalate dehydratase large subunit n=1 Tax=candidate division WOR-3 bacterium RBG_13_43_14 TaxID=1802590 RepID=A0A1F4UAL6_UNCW3|nr:MAG: 3-isopropylmalate dehydratase large subunit [candidate division WOR-3 bacterium RBG_13_43_14]